MRQLTTILDNRVDGRSVGLHLVVMGPDVFFTQALPAAGSLTIGRADGADVRISDPLASRLHARLTIGPGGRLDIEDLGSINRAKIRDQKLEPGERVAIVPGEAVTIGSTIVMVQESRSVGRPRRIWPHAYFEPRLEEECARSADTKAPFVALRLNVAGDLVPAAVADIIGPALRSPDMLALYGPREYELLLPNTTPELGSGIADDLVARLREKGTEARAGMAAFPRDGRTPEALLSIACDRVRGIAPQPATPDSVVVAEPSMRRLYDLAARAAAGTINILLMGETGVGKEVLADAVHRASPRASAPMVCLNCASLTENLLESELFGHEKGSFTGATSAKPGLLETAPGGTVFFDEIGELPLGLQAKLLRVIETRRVARIGSVKEREIDVRFVAATNRNLETAVAAGEFRRDLYFRLNGITLQIPPLRERRSEIASLARLFLQRFCQQLGPRSVPTLSPEALGLLERYCWPGNIRELRNVIERALLLSSGDTILPEHLPVETMTANALLMMPPPPAAVMGSVTPAVVVPMPEPAAGTPFGSRPTASAMAAPSGGEDDDAERERILQVLNECAGNQSRAARVLGIARSTLVARLEQYGVPRPRK